MNTLETITVIQYSQSGGNVFGILQLEMYENVAYITKIKDIPLRSPTITPYKNFLRKVLVSESRKYGVSSFSILGFRSE